MALVIPLWLKAAAALAALRAFARRRARPAPMAPPPPTPPAPTIRLGSTGPAVAFWRFVVGVGPGESFDAATDAATRDWQTAHGLSADGVVGPATWATVGIGGTHAPRSPAAPPAGPIGPPPPPPPAPAPGPGLFGLANDIQQREQQILEHVAQGHVDHEWAPLEYQANGRTIRMLVSRRALALRAPTGERLIISTTYPTAQKIADALGGAMLTSRISDEVWKHAPTRIAPLARPWSQDGTMAHTDRMVEQSAGLDRRVAQAGDAGGLVANEGKDWVITRRNWLPPQGTGVDKPEGAKGSRHNGANFGWYLAGSPSHSPGGESVIQSIGLAHDRGHVDYSQLLRFVKRDSVTVDGVPIEYAAALADPTLSPLIQDEGGTMPSDRHPDL